MAEQDDIFVGRRLLEAGGITQEELIESLFDMAIERRSGRSVIRPLGVFLLARGRLTQAALNQLLTERVRPPPEDATVSQATDLAIGDVLVAAGAATAVQVNECLHLQREGKRPGRPSKRLGELLVEKGYSTVAQVQRALAYLRKSIQICDQCGTRYNIVGAHRGRVYACPECGGELAEAGGGSVAVHATPETLPIVRDLAKTNAEVTVPAMQMPELPPVAQALLDRAVKVYLKQKTKVRRSILHEAERFQVELSRYGLWVSFLDIVLRFGGLTWQQAETIRKTDFQAIVQSNAWKQQTVPGYRIFGKIASGGFATIFSAEQILSGRKVALKMMHADRARDETAVMRFKHEAALMIRFHHPNIVRGHEYFEEGTLKFLAMELIEGDSLDRLVAEARGMPACRALSIAAQIAEALRYMQMEGYIHRDVKPENVLVDREGRAKLCDLGFALEMKADATGKSATTVGTAAYMSPEQARGELDLKVGTDIYALGLTLYFMLTAREPFTGESSGEVLAERFSEGVAAPDLASVRAPEPLLGLLKRMLHPQREKRFGAYPELLAAMGAMKEAMGGSS
ncbi:MAG: serine/threonine protein kinase [Planctomycetes bacterium]|nr:serine/threonine protein kinase [Planctomycetota bacterium]